jgi:hypothetical protein
MARTLNGSGHLSLVTGAGTGLAAWPYFSILSDISTKQVNLLVIYYNIFISAELADFWARNITTTATELALHTHFIIHYRTSILKGKLISRVLKIGAFTSFFLAVFAPFSKDHHIVGNNFDTGMFDTFTIIPAAGLKPAFDVDLLTFTQMLAAYFRQVAPGNDVEPLCLSPFLSVSRIPGTACCDRKSGDRSSRWGITHLRVTSQVANDHYFI